eukprot:m.149579 g.149579  ORF g.149579 m.149579 type:complete len:251 (+) comp30667_c0_seq2:140-892(+)
MTGQSYVVAAFTPTLNKLHRLFEIKSGIAVMYNMVQLVGWCFCAFSLVTAIRNDGIEKIYTSDCYEVVGPTIVQLQELAFIEIVFSLFGIIPSSLPTVVLQLIARNFVILVTVARSPHVQSHQSVALFVFAWVCIEIIRFQWLIFKVVGSPAPALSFIRYACPIVLYPIGLVGEAWSIYRASGESADSDILLTVGELTLTLSHVINYVYFPLAIPGFAILYMNALKQFSKQRRVIHEEIEGKTASVKKSN